MIIYTAEDIAADESIVPDPPGHTLVQPFTTHEGSGAFCTAAPATRDTTDLNDTSIVHFCEFVDYYTQQSTNPLFTALTCEHQADAIQITDQDLTPETIRLLIDTMLSAIEHLEKKWLDEQIQREEVQAVTPQRVQSQGTPPPIATPLRETASMLKQWVQRYVQRTPGSSSLAESTPS